MPTHSAPGGALYSWCLDHGRLHAYRPDQDATACTARRIYLDATGYASAMTMKELQLTGIKFFNDLDDTTQRTLAENRRRKVKLTAAGGLIPFD